MKLSFRESLLWLPALLMSFTSLAQTSLHYWDFNTGVSGTPWATPIVATQTMGGGSLSHPYGAGTDAFAGSTQDAPGFTTASAGATFSVVGNANNGGAFILSVPTTGYQDIKYTYSTRGTATGFTTHTIDYSADGVSFTNFATITGRTNTTFTLQTVDFTAITAANDNPNFKIRVTVTGATNATGNNRFDNMRIVGNTIAVANSIAVAAGANTAEGGSNGTFGLALSPVTPGAVTVDYAFTGSATFTSDYTVSFTGATSNSSTASGTLTIPTGTTAVTVNISPVDDALIETTETITLTLTNPTGGYVLGISSASINLSDNDLAAIDFTGAYSHDFNTLSNTVLSSTLPQGWLFSETGTGSNTTYGVDNGGSNAGNTYSYGASATTERAFGGLQSGAVVPTVGAMINNNTGATLGSFQITYTGEQWRLGAVGRSDKLDFQYSLNATTLSNGTWVDVDGLDFIAPVSGGTVGAIDGNATGNKTTINYTINGLSIPAGANFMIRWRDTDASGSDDGLAIDDVSFSLGCVPPAAQPTLLNLTPALQAIGGTFTAAAGADSYLVLISTSPTLTEQPVSGNPYNTDDVIGNATVVSVDGLSFNAAGLTPSTTYYFFVYAMVAASNCINTTAALTGSIATTTPPACTPPVTQASNLAAANITGTSIDISYTRGSGDNVLVVARATDAINAGPINSLNYTVGTEIGSGNFVVFNGTAAGFTHSGLLQNTTYNYALYEYNSADFCYTAVPLTGSFMTACVTPVNVSAFGIGIGNALLNVNWTNPSGSCFDEIVIVASTAPIAGTGDTYVALANPVYGSGEQVVYRGTGGTVTVSGLTNGTTYYFKAFTRKGIAYSAGIQASGSPFDPASGYLYLYGNLHAHSSYSDGNKADLSKTPADDYAFARDALCMDFMGMSEHNHAGAGMNLPDYTLGYNQANAINGVTGPHGNTLVTLFGMEWGVIKNGGHVLIYGFDNQLIGWEPGNYDIFVNKSTYVDLWPVINARPGAFATLAHPDNTDYSNLLSGSYNAVADNAVVGVAIESGPAFSTSTTYNDFPSSLNFLSYYKGLLAKGYRVSPQMDQDNHYMSFGTANSNRLVALTSGRSREALMEALRSGRYYASQDCNVHVDYKNGGDVMGAQAVKAGLPQLSMNVTDPDGENVSTIELWGGAAGAAVPGSPLKTYTAVNTFSFGPADAQNLQPDNSSYYYFAIITQEDGNKIVTSPIYYTRSDATLPLQLMVFQARYNKDSNAVLLNWSTAAEVNTQSFVIERSVDGSAGWSAIGTVAAAGNRPGVAQYQFSDKSPVTGNNLYRLRMVDIDGKYTYSPVRNAAVGATNAYVYSVYPNPAPKYTYLNSTNVAPEKVTAQLLDGNGRIVRRQQYTVSSSAPAKVDLSGVSAGMYYMKVLSEKGVVTLKVLVRE